MLSSSTSDCPSVVEVISENDDSAKWRAAPGAYPCRVTYAALPVAAISRSRLAWLPASLP